MTDWADEKAADLFKNEYRAGLMESGSSALPIFTKVVAQALREARNQGLEEAAVFVEKSEGWARDRQPMSHLPTRIRNLKKSV